MKTDGELYKNYVCSGNRTKSRLGPSRMETGMF